MDSGRRCTPAIAGKALPDAPWAGVHQRPSAFVSVPLKEIDNRTKTNGYSDPGLHNPKLPVDLSIRTKLNPEVNYCI